MRGIRNPRLRQECPICDEANSRVWLEREGVPVHQNRVWPTQGEARDCPRGDLLLAYCRTCGFVWNTAFDPSRLTYDAHYDNQQGWSGAFRAYMTGIAQRLVREQGLSGATVLEVGCGKGDFLNLLLDAGIGAGVGVDSSYEGPLETRGGRLRFLPEYLRGPVAGLKPQLVVSRHVVEHVPRPMDLLRTLAAQVETTPNALVFIETPTIRWILEGGVFWDLFYEHCSYFDTTTLPWACERAGLQPFAVRVAFEGQYQWVEARHGDAGAVPTVRLEPDVTAALVARYTHRATHAEALMRQTIERHAESKGGVAVWGAGAKGATFLHLIDPVAKIIRYVIDLNPAKQGRFLPATGHAIVSPKSITDDPPAVIILMNRNYQTENAALLTGLGLEVPLLAVESAGGGDRGEVA